MNREDFNRFCGQTLFAETLAWKAGYDSRTKGLIREPTEHSTWWNDGWECRNEELIAASRPYIPKVRRTRGLS